MMNILKRSLIIVFIGLSIIGCSSKEKLLTVLYENTIYFDDLGFAGSAIEAFKFNYQYKIKREVLGSGVPVAKIINSEIKYMKDNEIVFIEIDESTMKPKKYKAIINLENKVEIEVDGKKYLESKRAKRK
jgi:hypothetical protein